MCGSYDHIPVQGDKDTGWYHVQAFTSTLYGAPPRSYTRTIVISSKGRVSDDQPESARGALAKSPSNRGYGALTVHLL